MRYLIVIFIVTQGFYAYSQETYGEYFSKKQYEDKPLPRFEKVRALIPQPVLEENPVWVEMYWKAWEIAFKRMKSPPPGSPLVSNFLDEGLDDNIYQWDTNFMVMFSRYIHHIFPGIQSNDNFYARQRKDGLIWRIYKEEDGAEHPWGGGENFARSINPPLFSWSEYLNYQVTGDKTRFRMVLPVLEKYVEWIDKHKVDQNTPHRLYWSNGQASGMDNTLRDTGRPGGHSSTSPMGWVDMSAQMVMNYNYLAFICEELGEKKKAKKFKRSAKEISERINEWMWNEEDGLYYDVSPEGEQVKIKTVACFWPMLAGVSSEEQNERLIANLKDPSSFWRKIIFPSLAADQEKYNPKGGYWLGSVWAPTNYAIIKGLEKNGYADFARECALRYLKGIEQVYNNTGTFWECYSPDFARPATKENGEIVARDFVGWTGLGPISLLIENIIGIDVHGANHEISWRLSRTDSHGIKNLLCGDAFVSLIYQRDASGEYIMADCDNQTSNIKTGVQLKVYHPQKGKMLFNIPSGAKEFKLEL
ncbi:hypothetical protein KZP23_12955 [Echinicola marina]|uniref:MGH1-like glycoside hydrolase domain-containing protein n=1 Tax=Echinicola marina TaxID=2859768 RepID=UPI001CF70030|nr:trehalase family glycosidase [Echinicola marina]UCS91658.1 hypothetical protein KZP23_12955 [Echinicola marina]